MADEERLVVLFEARMAEFERNLKRANRAGADNWNSIENRFRRGKQNLDSISSSLGRSLIAPLTGIGAALSGREVARYADAWTNANNALKVAGVTGTQQAAVMNELFASAQRNAAPISALTRLYGTAAQVSNELGASQGDLIRFTDGIAVALKVAGTDATQASGALSQLGQALGSAKVRAEEFNSIQEGARPILQAVAVGLETAGGSVAKLKELVNEGAVTNRDFFQAFLKGLPSIQAMAAEAVPTIAQGFTKISNAMTRYVGQTDEGLGATQRLVQGLNALADNFNTTADLALKVAGIIAAGLIGRAIAPMIVSLGMGTAALFNFVTALKTAGAMAGPAGLASAFGGLAASAGPIGLLIGTVVAGSLLVFSARSNDATAGGRLFAAELAKIKQEADKTAPAVDNVNKRLADFERAQTQLGIDAATAEITKLRRELSNLIGSLELTEAAYVFTPAQQQQAKDMIQRFLDGKASADELRNAFGRLTTANPNFSGMLSSIDRIVEAMSNAGTAADRLKAKLASIGSATAALLTPPDESANARSRSSTEDALRLGQAITRDIERRNGLNSEQIRLLDKIKEIQDQVAKEGGTINNETARRLAQQQITAEDRRSEEDKTARRTGQRRTVDDSFNRDVQAIRDRTAMLLLETQVVGKSVEEQERRKMALELETQALNRIRDTARQNGDANWRNLQLTDAQKNTINEVAAAYGKQADALRRVTEQHDRAKQAAEEFYSTSKNELIDVVMGTKRLDQALVNIAKRLANLALNGLFDALFKPAGGGGIFGSLVGGFGKMFGFADGGQVRGPGTGRSDSILARVSNGEYVVNAKATSRHLPLLDAINTGKAPGFADGGRVGPIPTPAVPAIPAGAVGAQAGPSMTFAPVVTAHVNAQGGDPKQNQDLADRTAKTMENKMREVAMDEMRRAMRPGGYLEVRS